MPLAMFEKGELTMTSNYLMKKLTGFFATGVAIAAFAAMPALAQGPPIQAPTVDVQINPNLVKVNRRQAIAFKPFEARDPKTGAPISPAASITLARSEERRVGKEHTSDRKARHRKCKTRRQGSEATHHM